MNKCFTSIADIPATRRDAEGEGVNPIRFHRLLNSFGLEAGIDFIDFTVIPPGSRIGCHRHEGAEEAYCVASGSLLMRIQDEPRRLSTGDMAVVRSGQMYELWNDTSEDVKIFLVRVRMRGERPFIHIPRKRALPSQRCWEADVPVLEMRTARPIHYRIVHPARPVFDLDEPALAEFVKAHRVLLAIDETVYRLYGEQIDRYCRRHLCSAGTVLVHAGERQKSWAHVERICREAISRSLPRDGFIVGVGGGTTLDTVGLASALFRRGVRYLRVPTTLVGLVDVGVGVKHGINFAGKKNILGAFYPPVGAISDLHFLRTVPQREIGCGLAEIIKMAVVCDTGLFELLESHGAELVASGFQEPPEVAKQVAVRAEQRMIEELRPNLFEQNTCRLVDFGHSFSQAIETASNYQVAHGEAVAVDMLMSTIIAVERGICDSDVLTRLERVYQKLSLPLSQSVCTADDFVGCLRENRLHRGGKLNLVAPTAIGSAGFLQDVQPEEVATAVARTSESAAGGTRKRYASAGI